LADVNWAHGTLVTPPTPEEPRGEGIPELLDEAEDIVNSAASEILAEVEEESGGRRGFFGRFRRRKR
jgi:hypothetical protein